MKERIKEVRKALGLNQEDFGKVLGVTKSSISNIESGRFNATDTTVKLICREFDVNEEWLRNGTGKMFDELDSDFISMSAKIEQEGSEFVKELTKTLWALDENELMIIKSIIDKIKNNPSL